jgi:hypothetical protein
MSGKIRNPKPEIRNKCEFQNLKSQIYLTGDMAICALDFEFVSEFGFHASDFSLTTHHSPNRGFECVKKLPIWFTRC